MRVSYQPNIFAVCSSRKELDFIFLILPGLQSVSKEKLETRTGLFLKAVVLPPIKCLKLHLYFR